MLSQAVQLMRSGCKYTKYCFYKDTVMKNIAISEEKRQKIHEFNERARLKLLLEAEFGKQVVHENVVVCYNGRLIDMPKIYADKLK